MHEKDIELVKLLHQSCSERESQLGELSSELESYRTELGSIEETVSSRAEFSDLLGQAAAVLDRHDLVVELPDASDLKEKVESLEQQFNSIEGEARKYRELLDQLTEKAPHLLEAAGIVESTPVDSESNGYAMDAEDAAVTESVETETQEPEVELERFDVKNIKRREKNGHGHGAVYIIDGASVVSRMPAYDFNQLEVEEVEAYDSLAHDLRELGPEISGSFCILTEEPLQLENGRGVEFAVTGNGSGEAESRRDALLRLATEYTGRLRNVCVVTGETDVMDSVHERGMHTMGLSEFFRA